ncbi:MAG: DDE-type integrase/transposase/recombinase [Nanoarchaeota archaeon]|nr:DDE-type integrase/transposase/recombinase [Nanoarchaeota archaeon]
MKKYVIRKEFLKLKINGKSYSQCKNELKERFGKNLTTRTLKNWWKRFNEREWDLEDISQRPNKLSIKFSEADKEVVCRIRKNFGYGPKKVRIQAQNEGVDMSISTVKRIIKQTGLSKGSKMEGVKLKWVRFERPYPNDMWQIDGDENDDGSWRVPVVDDCSRYCLGVYDMKDNTTEAMIAILEDCIRRHGKPKQLLTDNGSEFGGPKGWDSEFDKWCDKQGIIHIRSGVHKPTTVGKISAIQRTIQAEIEHWNGDTELWRMMYNHERPHESLRGLTPAVVYFQFKRHKKHYEL